MCGRFTIIPNKDTLEARFGARFGASFLTSRYNAAPSQALPVILNTEPDTIQYVEWGLRPWWMTRASKGEGIINVQAETLRERPTFRRDVAERRCIVLADSFYEWRKGGKQKIPYRILLRSEEPFAFAGIWEEDTTEGGQPNKMFAIITMDANELVRQVHNRMPVILRREAERQWLEDEVPPEKRLSLLTPYPQSAIKMYEVSRRVNRATVDQPDIIQRVR
jgi:putative SOS response-associated peptidase YedK